MASVVLPDPAAAKNPFFALAPNSTVVLLMVILSTAATVIASQALITGVFSLSRQAVQLNRSVKSVGDRPPREIPRWTGYS
jgi:KUP system potassium uptake protein